MGVSISIGYIDKRVNSTKRQGFTPSVSASDVVLKDNCDIKNPILQIKGSAGNYNYMTWGTEDATRYYWVDKVVPIPNGIIEVYAHLDPLATYQKEIFNTRTFCVYGSVNDWNKETDDPRMQPEKIDRTNSDTKDIFDFSMTKNNGTYILTVYQSGAGKQGVCTYALDKSELEDCLVDIGQVLSAHEDTYSNIANQVNNELSSFTSTDDVANIIGAAQTVAIKKFEHLLCGVWGDLSGVGSWRDNLLRIIYVPIPKDVFTGTAGNMYMGTINCGSHLRIKASDVRTKNTALNLYWCTKNTANHRFLCYPRFQQFQVSCMGGAYQSIDPLRVKDKLTNGQIYCYSSIDICSGDWSCVINTESSLDSEKLASFSGNCGIDVTGYVGKGGSGNVMQTMNTIGGAIASAFTGGVTDKLNAGSSFAAASDARYTGISNSFLNNGASAAATGTTGGGISSMFLTGELGKVDIAGTAFYPEMLDNQNLGTYVDFCHKHGYPCNKFIQLGTVKNAFYQCSGASVECKGTQSDVAYINSVCNSGIYIED